LYVASDEPSDRAFEDELRSLLFAGKKIEAVKRYRARTGLGLKLAVDAINALEQGEALPLPAETHFPGSMVEGLEAELIPLLENGQKIQAIKVYRERTGVGLKEAKDAVERLAAVRGITAAQSGCLGAVIVAVGLLFASLAQATEQPAFISCAICDRDGFLVHSVQSAYQAEVPSIKVLLPDRMVVGKCYPVVYVLPVEAGEQDRYGNGLREVKTNDLHNVHQAIFVAPTFSHLPWYADHPTNGAIRQESYFLKVVVPFIERTYPALTRPEGRLLLGFSKSGWGAWSLLLRHPDTFGRAAAWDSPLMMDHLGQFGTTAIFGTQDCFEQYRVSNLLRSNAGQLATDNRLILTGYGNFRDHHQRIHQLAAELKVSHIYRDGPKQKHDWHGGWVPEAVALLMAN
jgi:ribosomal protein L7/L12